MNIREIDRLISRLQENTEQNVDLIIFYNKKRTDLLHKICDELILKLGTMKTFNYTFIFKDSNSNVLQTKFYDCINENDAKELSNILYGNSSQYLDNCKSVIFFRTNIKTK